MMTNAGARTRRLALFCHALDGRAIAQLCAIIGGELVALGCAVTLVAVRVDERMRRDVPAGVRVVELRAPVDRSLFAVPALARWLRRERPDVLFSQHNGPNRAAVLARMLARVPTAVVTVEQNHYSTYISPRGGRYSFSWLRDRMTRLLYARADRVAGVAPEVVDDLAERFPGLRGKTRVLPNPGPDPERLAALAREPADHPWCGAPRSFRIVCNVANVIPRKGQDVLLAALAEIRRREGDVRLLVVGRPDNPSYLAALERRAAELGVAEYVSFAGYRANPLPIVARCDAFALASRNEGAPLVLIEAMACGVPIVSTDCQSGPRYLLEGGRCGRLVPVDDAMALADALVELLTDDGLRERLVAEGRRRAAEFTPRRVAEAYLALAVDCLAEREARPSDGTLSRPAPVVHAPEPGSA
jgi:glycosyltransferase involved in cell wall biosynthesis